MKKIAMLAGIFISISAFAQQQYWQQNVAYTIDVALNDKEHSLKAQLQLEYTNNSPDKLDFIWFHLWPNAYKNENTAFAKQIMKDGDGKKRWKSIKDKGFIDSLNFKVNGKGVAMETHPEYIDVVKILLPEPLLPGSKINISTPFYVKLATYNSRSGYDDGLYIACQWYPKPAVYDRKGWHPMPYLDQGEFYSEFGSFNVNLTVPSNYIVGATGSLQNKDELMQYKEMGQKNVNAKSNKNVIKYNAPLTATKTLNYKGEQIHDFAWFANKDFVVRYDTLQTASGKVVDVFSYHHSDGNKNWVNSTSYIKSGTRAYSDYLGEYAYPVVQAVEGPKNEMSGGMEYPMITLITSPKATIEMLDAVITHEVGHNWLYGMLATNERQHPWMDEGINTYLQFRYEAEKYRANSVFGDNLPEELKKKTVNEFQAMVYDVINKNIPMEEAIETPSADFKNKEEYGLTAYLKTAVWMYLMELNFGQDKLQKGLQSYFNQWKFKHPYPEDLKTVLEKEIGQDLTSYFDILKKKGSL